MIKNKFITAILCVALAVTYLCGCSAGEPNFSDNSSSGKGGSNKNPYFITAGEKYYLTDTIDEIGKRVSKNDGYLIYNNNMVVLDSDGVGALGNSMKMTDELRDAPFFFSAYFIYSGRAKYVVKSFNFNLEHINPQIESTSLLPKVKIDSDDFMDMLKGEGPDELNGWTVFDEKTAYILWVDGKTVPIEKILDKYGDEADELHSLSGLKEYIMDKYDFDEEKYLDLLVSLNLPDHVRDNKEALALYLAYYDYGVQYDKGDIKNYGFMICSRPYLTINIVVPAEERDAYMEKRNSLKDGES